jgi:hypothetical protein
MTIRTRLVRLERRLDGARTADWCSLCGDGQIEQIRTYEVDPDGTRRLVMGQEPQPCSACGRTGRLGDVTEIEVVRSQPRQEHTDTCTITEIEVVRPVSPGEHGDSESV